MAKLREANEELSGDEDSEEEEDTGMGEVDVENAGITEWNSIERDFFFFLKYFCSCVFQLSLLHNQFQTLYCWGILPTYQWLSSFFK